MPDTKISGLNSLTKSTVAPADVLPIVDTSVTETKKITYQELIRPQDDHFRIAGSSDPTKLVAFEVDGLTTATTRTLTVPDANTTIVGTDTTQTLTNKTLTSPQINFGSDANGDLIYRNGSGVTARLPIGSTDQILAVQSGLPTWIANPSASAASATVAGIVELATTAETETGTDATRAVTPDGLNDMTTLAGKAWFLDEDAMTSDSAVKVPSQQSVKAYVDASNKFGTGYASKAVNQTTDQTIAHGLGVTPKLVRITCFSSPTTNINAMSIGTGTATNAEQVVGSVFYTGSGDDTYTDTSSILLIKTEAGTTVAQANLKTLDSTNIVLEWTTNSSSGGTRQFIWEAYA